MATPALRVGVGELLAHPGERRPFVCDVPASDLGAVATSTANVPGDGTVHLDLVLESILPPSIVVTGSVTFPWAGECRRCLTEIEAESTLDLREIAEAHPTEGETYPLRNETVDLAAMVYDAVLLSLPLAPLCGPDCKGPAPESFPARIEGEDEPATDADPADAADADEGARRPRDPRWAALDQLDFD